MEKSNFYENKLNKLEDDVKLIKDAISMKGNSLTDKAAIMWGS